MRIDFGASFKDVSRLLRASSQPNGPGNGVGFEKDLDVVLTNPPPTLGDTKEPQHVGSIARSMPNPIEDMKASLRTPDLGMTEALMSPYEPQDLGPIQEGVPSEGVKTPTLLEVKRIKIDKEMPVAEELPKIGSEEIRAQLKVMSEKIGLDPSLTMAVVKAESSFNTTAVSRDGHASKGLFQLLDTTGKTLLSRSEDTGRKYDPFNPDLNMELGTSYLKYLHSIFDNSTELPNKLKTHKAADADSLEKLAVAAFNAGEGRVASAQRRSERAGKDPSQYEHVAPFLPRSTREYVSRVVEGKKLF